MMSLAGLLIFALSIRAIKNIERNYYRNGETDLNPDELFSRASLEDIIRLRHFGIQLWIGLGFMTIGSTLKVMH